MECLITNPQCSGGNIIGKQCPNEPKWINQNGVIVCDTHKELLDAFTWENRNSRAWRRIDDERKRY